MDAVTLSFFAALIQTVISVVAFFVNVYLLLCARYLRRPITVSLRLCVTLTAADAACAFTYIVSYAVNIILPFWLGVDSIISNCISLLIEVFKTSTFSATIFNLLVLAVVHYVGIVYPLRRHNITFERAMTAVAVAYLVPFALFFTLFSLDENGFRSESTWSHFLSIDGCGNAEAVLRSPLYRLLVPTPFFIFVVIVSVLYLHIVIRMKRGDPLLEKQNQTGRGMKNRRAANRRLSTTLMLLAGSAILGWLPTMVQFVSFSRCIHCSMEMKVGLGFVAQLCHVLKLLIDAFIYASRLIEIRYAVWMLNSNLLAYMPWSPPNKSVSIPIEFQRYLNETREQRSTRIRRERNDSASSLQRMMMHRSISCDNGGGTTSALPIAKIVRKFS